MKTRIAIVSDISLFCNIFIPLFKKTRNETQVDVCRSIEDIDKIFKCNSYDLILVDGGLTQMSCFEAIQHIQNSNYYQGPIIFFPEITTEEYLSKSKIMGVTKIIPKPFDPIQVVNDFFSIKISTSAN